jgi:hypothetical protein
MRRNPTPAEAAAPVSLLVRHDDGSISAAS